MLSQIKERLSEVLWGKNELIDLALATFFSGGHLLLEGPPGTGKTSLARGLAGVFGGVFHRIQMTSDLLPSDVVGMLRFKPGSTEFEFRPGPIFANFLLADELNRTSPKTQSALLEAMAEGTATVDGVMHALPDPFFVVATQNPLEFSGVYPLAESQVDRFMMQLVVEIPTANDELEIYRRALKGGSLHGYEKMTPLADLATAQKMRAAATSVFVEPSIVEYAASIVRETRSADGVSYGASIRGGLQLLAAARGLAYVRGREFVVPKDVQEVAVPVLAHRLCFTDAQPTRGERERLLQQALSRTISPH